MSFVEDKEPAPDGRAAAGHTTLQGPLPSGLTSAAPAACPWDEAKGAARAASQGDSGGSLGPVHSGKTAAVFHKGTELRVRSAAFPVSRCVALDVPLSLWASLSSPVKWESLPLGVDVKTVRLMCEKGASRGSRGSWPALFLGLGKLPLE